MDRHEARRMRFHNLLLLALLAIFFLVGCGGGGGGSTSSGGDSGGGNSGGEPPTPATPPIATTERVSRITATEATINGSAIANGSPTTGWFEWGTSSTLSTFSKTPSQDLGSDSLITIHVKAAITGLTKGKTYYYRFVAQNKAGKEVGHQEDFILTETSGTYLDGKQTSDGGYVFVGWTKAFGEGQKSGFVTPNVYLVKMDAERNILWQSTFGGLGEDEGYSVQQTSDGGYIITGYTYPSYPHLDVAGKDVYLIKTDALGNAVWTKNFGGTGGDHGDSVRQTSDGGYIVVGRSITSLDNGTSVYLIKTDASGKPIWEKTFGETGHDAGYSVQQTSDGGYIVVGITNLVGINISDVYLIKTDASGNAVWNKTFGGIYGDSGSSVRQTSDGGYIIVGTTNNNSYGYPPYRTGAECYLIKTDASGNAVWTKSFKDQPTWGNTSGRSVQETSDGGYIVAGDAYTGVPYSSTTNAYLIKTDSAGNTVWTRTFTNGGGSLSALSVQQSPGGGYIVVGSDMYIIKTDANGN